MSNDGPGSLGGGRPVPSTPPLSVWTDLGVLGITVVDDCVCNCSKKCAYIEASQTSRRCASPHFADSAREIPRRYQPFEHRLLRRQRIPRRLRPSLRRTLGVHQGNPSGVVPAPGLLRADRSAPAPAAKSPHNDLQSAAATASTDFHCRALRRRREKKQCGVERMRLVRYFKPLGVHP